MVDLVAASWRSAGPDTELYYITSSRLGPNSTTGPAETTRQAARNMSHLRCGSEPAGRAAAAGEHGELSMASITSPMKRLLPAAAVAALAAGAAQAADIKPAVVFDIGGKFDKSFNEAVAKGADK